MNNMADPKSYRAVIDEIRAFENRIEQSCQQMEQAANSCVGAMNGDDAAERAKAKLSRNIAKVREQYETLHRIMSALNEEMEEIIQANSEADF